jgi:hypothetical protein
VEIYNVSVLWEEGGWIFVAATEDNAAAAAAGGAAATAGEATVGWAAVRPVWSGYNLSAGLAGSSNRSFRVLPLDVYSPTVLVAGGVEEFGTAANFTAAVLAAPLVVTRGGAINNRYSNITFEPSWLPNISFPWADGNPPWLPSVGGQQLDDTPPLVYDGPFMHAPLGSEVVIATAKPLGVDLVLAYDFGNDTAAPPVVAAGV